MIGLTRRATLLTGLAAAGEAHAQTLLDRPDPTSFGPPPAGAHPYGLNSALTAKPWIEHALRGLGEPALLTPQATVTSPTFRLLEMRRRPRAARIIFDREDGGATVVLKQTPSAAAASAALGGRAVPTEFLNRPIAGILSLDPMRGLRLRQLVDDEDRFWNGASNPPDWSQITAAARNEIVVTAGGWSVVLEGRVGAKRHAILRSTPGDESWLGKVSEQVFGRRNPD